MQIYLPATTQQYRYPSKRSQVDPLSSATIQIPSLRCHRYLQAIDGIDRTPRTGPSSLPLHSGCVAQLGLLVVGFDNTLPSAGVDR